MRNPRPAILSLILFAAALAAFSGVPAPGRQDVVITIKEGMPAISIAIPPFTAPSAAAKSLAGEIQAVLEADIRYTRIFQPLPSSYFDYIGAINPAAINFKDLESIQASILLVGEAAAPADDSLTFSWKLYDVKRGQPIQGKQYQGKRADLRFVAHKAVDDILRLYGEKPVFTTKIAFVSDRDGNPEIYMMDYDGANQTRLTFNSVQDISPVWSPDQKRIAYTSYQGLVAGLYILDVYEGRRTAVATRGGNFSPAWSPDGKRLAFASSMDGNHEIYVAEIESNPTRVGKIKRLTFNPDIDTAPSWSPTGRQLAFVSARGGTPQIYTMDAEGGNVTRVSTFAGSTYYDSPAWSPAGDRIVFVARVDNIFDLYVLNLRSQQITKLTESNARNESPSWSPDGRHVVFTSNMKGGLQLFSIDYDGANLRPLTSRGQNNWPAWGN
jgi:TolB protein